VTVKAVKSRLEMMRDRLNEIIGDEKKLLRSRVVIRSRPHECIPSRPGMSASEHSARAGEWIVEASLPQTSGEAIARFSCSYDGILEAVLGLSLDDERNRALVVSTVNALLCELKLVEHTLNCESRDPQKCGIEIVRTVLKRYGLVHIGMVGLKPSLLEKLVETFGTERVRVVDPAERNIGTICHGVDVWSVSDRISDLVRRSDVVLFTGATLVNGIFDPLWEQIQDEGKEYIAYGNTILGIGRLMGVDGICPFAR